MKSKLDDLAVMIANFGLDPRAITLEQVLGLIRREADLSRGRAMAQVKLNKAPLLVTIDEAVAALRDWATPGNEELTARTWRAGEVAYQDTLVERKLYDEELAARRATTNLDLDNGEVTLMSKPSPTTRRRAGRPSRSRDFARMLAVDVEYRRSSGEASSNEKVIEKLTGRDRNGDVIAGIVQTLILPNGRKSHWTIHAMLRTAAREAPSAVKEAREQGEIIRTGGQPDPAFMARLVQIRGILANPAAIKSMLRAERRKN